MPAAKKGGGKAKPNKAALKAEKKAKTAAKADRKSTKQAKKSRKDEGIVDEEDLLQTLEDYRRAWEAEHAVTQEVVGGPPSRRANASFIPCPVSDHLWLFGGEYFHSETRCEFYSDLFRYSPDKNEWRTFRSPTAPGPRSACAMVGTAAGGGKLWLFGGEFAAANLSAFHHYRDLWCFDIATTSWERFDTRVRPSARSGHRMAMWKSLLVLYGGFVDTGIKTRYLSDLWIFDTAEFKWHEVQFGPTDRQPGPRSGFSFVPAAEGVVLYGGYRKEYQPGKPSKGVPLDDQYLLTLDPETPSKAKWEKRRRIGFVPSLRSGASMALWPAKAMGVLLGGVTDDETEEIITSTFHNDMFALQLGTGRWLSLNLKRKKKPGGRRKVAPAPTRPRTPSDDEHMDENDEGENADGPPSPEKAAEPVVEEDDPDDPERTRPHPRYSAMIAVLGSTAFIYGGVLEVGSREATLDDFYKIRLDKLERFECLRAAEIDFGDQVTESEGESDDDEADSDDSDAASEAGSEEGAMAVDEQAPGPVADLETDLRDRAQAFLSVSQQADRSEEDRMSSPLPGETLKTFYDRTRTYWAGRAHETSDNRGKLLRRDGFAIAEERFEQYRPILLELERIQAQAGLDAEEAKAGANVTGAASRNRR